MVMTCWVYKDKPFIDVIHGIEAFVYIVTNSIDGRAYVGKKSFYSKIKGERIESDWLNYFGSSDDLNQDIAHYGQDKFHREILFLCRTNGDAGYLEACEQMKRDVLRNDNYYNKNILGRYRIAPTFYGDFDVGAVNSLEALARKGVAVVTNGKINKFMNEKKAEKLVKTSEFIFGKFKKDANSKITKKLAFTCENNKIKKLFPLYRKNNIVWQTDIIDEILPTVYHANNGLKQKEFKSESDLKDFIGSHSEWVEGLFCKQINKVYMVDVNTNEKVYVAKGFKLPHLVSLKTPKVRIKRNNRVIFDDGYLLKFSNDNPHYKLNFLKDCLRTGLKTKFGNEYLTVTRK